MISIFALRISDSLKQTCSEMISFELNSSLNALYLATTQQWEIWNVHSGRCYIYKPLGSQGAPSDIVLIISNIPHVHVVTNTYRWSIITRNTIYEGLPYMQVVCMVILGLLVLEHLQTEVVWRCVWTTGGGLYVMTVGPAVMQELHADSLAIQISVSSHCFKFKK